MGVEPTGPECQVLTRAPATAPSATLPNPALVAGFVFVTPLQW